MARESEEMKVLYRRAAAGDTGAVGQLVSVELRRYFCGVIKKYCPTPDDDTVDELLHAFYEYIFSPTSDGLYRLRALKADNEPKWYMGRMFDNFLNDYFVAKSNLPTTGTDLTPADTADESDPAMRASTEDAEVEALLKALEFAGNFSAEDRYILLTYLLSERFSGTGRPLKLNIRLGAQLGKNPSTVYNIYDRRMQKVRTIAREELRKILTSDSTTLS